MRLTESVQLAKARDSDRDIGVPGERHEAKDTTESGEEPNCPQKGTEGPFWGQLYKWGLIRDLL